MAHEAITLLQWIQTGGDLIGYVLVYFLWRFDRRLLTIELRLNAGEKPKMD